MDEIKGYIPNPIVVEQTARGERQYDIYSRLLLDRIIFLGTEINDTVANLIIAQMLVLEQNDPEAPINFYINSPGGSVYGGLGIYDIMQHVTPPVHTFCVGLAASMGAFLLMAGAKGFRHCLPHGRVMIHQPHGGARGQCEDIQIQAREINKNKKIVHELMATHTGKSVEEVFEATERDRFMSAQEALDFGLIDSILSSTK